MYSTNQNQQLLEAISQLSEQQIQIVLQNDEHRLVYKVLGKPAIDLLC